MNAIVKMIAIKGKAYWSAIALQFGIGATVLGLLSACCSLVDLFCLACCWFGFVFAISLDFERQIYELFSNNPIF
jgi:hypothetical protein